MIKEVSTCSYLMIIYTPRLCNDGAFLPPQENLANPITCQPVLSESEIDGWNLAGLEEKVRETERLIADYEKEQPLGDMAEGAAGTTKRRPIIGGIEVGAQSLVGSEGKVIEKTVVVGGGKDTFAGTLATSDGKQMSAAELKKLNIDPKDVEKLKQNSQRIAGRKEWRLDLINTPDGREFRLVLEADEREESKEKEKSVDEKGRGMGTGKDDVGKAAENDEGRGGEQQEGSEEVYKDEL